MAEWDAEVEIDATLARELISAQFPQLDSDRLERVGEGWDNTVWATGDGVAFRFPRRAVALPGVQREMAVLPWLARRLPAPVPDARYVGTPTERFPWPWFGSELIGGREITEVLLPAPRRGELAADLGSFLAALHALEPPAALEGTVDPNARADMAQRVPRTRTVLAAVASYWPGGAAAEPILAAAERLGPSTERVLVHGDLNLRHLLLSDTGRLEGVIDWGDMCLASRGLDLMLYWSLFEAAGRDAFLAAYGPVDADTMLRARVLALCLCAMLAAYATDKAWHTLAAEALAGLTRTLVD